MKKLFIAMLAVAAVTACAKDEAISLNQESIDFGAPFVENSTRATDPSLGTTDKPFEKFQVWGTAGDVAIYAGDNVTGSVGLNSVWTCTKQNFWVNGVVYKFAAVANGDANVDMKTKVDVENGLPKTISYTADGVSDLIYAENFGQNNNGIVGKPAGQNSAVALTFNHLLAKAKFTVTTGAIVDGYQYKVTNIKITNAYGSGDYNVANGTWSDTTDKAQTFDDIVVNAISVESANEKLLIPLENVAVSFTAALYFGNDVIWSDTVNKTLENDLVAGNSYNFTIGLNMGEEIKFNVATNPGWTNNDPVTVQ